MLLSTDKNGQGMDGQIGGQRKRTVESVFQKDSSMSHRLLVAESIDCA